MRALPILLLFGALAGCVTSPPSPPDDPLTRGNRSPRADATFSTGSRWAIDPNVVVVADLPENKTFTLTSLGDETPGYGVEVYYEAEDAEVLIPGRIYTDGSLTLHAKKIELRGGGDVRLGLIGLSRSAPIAVERRQWRLTGQPNVGELQRTPVLELEEETLVRVEFASALPNTAKGPYFTVFVDNEPVLNSSDKVAAFGPLTSVFVYGKKVAIAFRTVNDTTEFDVRGWFEVSERD